MKLAEIMLDVRSTITESREDYLQDKFGEQLQARAHEDSHSNLTAAEVIKELKKADPLDGKNLQFIVRMYLAKQFKLEDTSRLRADISKFEKFKSKMSNKDLNSFNTLNDLYDVLETFADEEQPVSKNKQAAAVKAAGADKIINDAGFTVLDIKDQPAACFYGSGTKWCTAADKDNKFDYYKKQGKIYVILAKIGGKDRKFQLQFESNQFVDERDQSVSDADIAALSKIPSYTKFMNMLVKQHYSKHFN